MRAVFHSCGNLQVFMNISKMWSNGNAKLWAHFLSKTFGMLSGPVEVEPFKVLRIRVTISGVKTI